MKSSTVTTTISTNTLIETTEQSVIETFDEIGNFLDLYTLSLLYKQRSDLATGLGALGVACECCLISKT